MPIHKKTKPFDDAKNPAPAPLRQPRAASAREDEIEPTPSRAPSKLPPPKSGGPTMLARLFGGNVFLLRFLIVAFAGAIIYIMIQPYLILSNFAGRERVIIYDPSGPVYSIAPIMDFADASEMHVSLIRDAIEAGWNRNPSGFARPDKAKMLFLKPAFAKLEAEIKANSADYAAKQFRQTAEVGKIVLTATTDDTIQAVVSVQLIRVGLFNGSPISESETKKIALHLIRNPNMYTNKRYPLAVAGF